jgi:hypothetical protein
LLGGAILGSAELITEAYKDMHRHTGPALSPFNAWVLLKGLETMDLRVRRQTETAATVIGVEKERADLGGAAVDLLEVKNGDLAINFQRVVLVALAAEFVAVERLVAADAGGDAAGADDGSGGALLEDEKVVLGSGLFDLR